MTTFSLVIYIAYGIFLIPAILYALKYHKDNMAHLKSHISNSQYVFSFFIAFGVSWVFFPLIIIEFIVKFIRKRGQQNG